MTPRDEPRASEKTDAAAAPDRSDDARTRGRPGDPWWLLAGAETCDVCLQPVQYEALYTCRECDRPLCMTCSVTVVERRIVLCSACAGEAG